jgi:hypothetical protein
MSASRIVWTVLAHLGPNTVADCLYVVVDKLLLAGVQLSIRVKRLSILTYLNIKALAL